MKLNKVGKRRIETLKNQISYEIILNLSVSANNSNGLSTIINRSQGAIYSQLIKLAEEKYIIPSDVKKNAYQVNYIKLIEEYNNFCNNTCSEKEIDMIKTCMKSKEFKTIQEIFDFVKTYTDYHTKYKIIENTCK